MFLKVKQETTGKDVSKKTANLQVIRTQETASGKCNGTSPASLVVGGVVCHQGGQHRVDAVIHG